VHLLVKRNFDVIKMHGTTIKTVCTCWPPPLHKLPDTTGGSRL